MNILAVLDEAAFNELPDATVLGKDGYIKDEKTSTFKLAMAGTEAEKLATGLQQKFDNKKVELDKVHGEKNGLAQELAKFSGLGKTPDELETILKEGVTADTEKLTKEYTTKLESVKAENQRLLDAAKAETEAAATAKLETEKHLISTIKRNEIAELRNEFGITKGGEDFFANRIDVVFDEDLKKYVPRVIENGEVAYKGSAYKTPKQLAEETKANKEFANIFEAGVGGGTGAPPRQGGGAPAGSIAVSRTAVKTNPDLYEQAKAKAAETGGQISWTE